MKNEELAGILAGACLGWLVVSGLLKAIVEPMLKECEAKIEEIERLKKNAAPLKGC